MSVEAENAKEEIRDLLRGCLFSGIPNGSCAIFRVVKNECVSPRGQLLILKGGVYDPVVYDNDLSGSANRMSLSSTDYVRIIRKARKVLVEEGLEPESVKKVFEDFKNLRS